MRRISFGSAVLLSAGLTLAVVACGTDETPPSDAAVTTAVLQWSIERGWNHVLDPRPFWHERPEREDQETTVPPSSEGPFYGLPGSERSMARARIGRRLGMPLRDEGRGSRCTEGECERPTELAIGGRPSPERDGTWAVDFLEVDRGGALMLGRVILARAGDSLVAVEWRNDLVVH